MTVRDFWFFIFGMAVLILIDAAKKAYAQYRYRKLNDFSEKCGRLVHQLDESASFCMVNGDLDQAKKYLDEAVRVIEIEMKAVTERKVPIPDNKEN